jgi:hypothetical protein
MISDINTAYIKGSDSTSKQLLIGIIIFNRQ